MMNTVTSTSLETFLQQLGRCYRFGGRVMLVGGSSLLLVGAKGNTLDVDLAFEVENHDEFIRCLRQVSRALKISVEQAAPHEFIPLPQGYEQRHQFIGRYNRLDIFHYDFYSIALSKIHRGNRKDFIDVTAMLEQNIIKLSQLEIYYNEILPQIDLYSFRSDSADFARKFKQLRSSLTDAADSQ